jgi:hypothetical protein
MTTVEVPPTLTVALQLLETVESLMAQAVVVGPQVVVPDTENVIVWPPAATPENVYGLPSVIVARVPPSTRAVYVQVGVQLPDPQVPTDELTTILPSVTVAGSLLPHPESDATVARTRIIHEPQMR